jgi:hypothetical protein
MAQENSRFDNPAEGDQHIRELIDEVAVLLELSSDFDEAWEIANRVCDRYGLGRAAA